MKKRLRAISRVVLAVSTLTCFSGAALLAQEGAAGSQSKAAERSGDVITEYRLPPETLTRSEALYRTKAAMLVGGSIYGLGVLALLLVMRVAPRFRDLAERASRRRVVQAMVFAPLFLLTLDVLSLPVSIYGQHLQVQYGLSVQSWGSWFWDWTKGELLGISARHRSRMGALRFSAPQFDAVVALRLADVDSRRAPDRIHRPDLHRAAVRHLRATRRTAAGTGPRTREGDVTRRAVDRALAHVRDAGQRQGDHLQRLRHRYRRKQARGGVGQHVARLDHSRDDIRLRPRAGTLRAAAHLEVDRIGDRSPAGAAVSRVPADGRPTGAVRATLGHTRHRRLGIAAGPAAALERVLDCQPAGVGVGLALLRTSGGHLRARGHPRPHA